MTAGYISWSVGAVLIAVALGWIRGKDAMSIDDWGLLLLVEVAFGFLGVFFEVFLGFANGAQVVGIGAPTYLHAITLGIAGIVFLAIMVSRFHYAHFG